MANEFKVKKGLIVDGTNTVLDIQGTQGQLFSVTDNLTGNLFSVSDISGVPIFNVNSSGASDFDGPVSFAAGTTSPFLAVTKNGSNQFPVVFANAENFSLSCSGTWSIVPTIASGDVGKTGTIIITNTATTTPGSLPSTFKTPNGDSVVFQTDNGDVSILSYIVVSTSIVLVNYVGNFS